MPVALAAGARLRTISAGASRAGLRAGMSTTEARARCAALDVMTWDDRVLARTITGVTAELLAASPRVTPAADEPGLWWVGADGFDALGGERALAHALLVIARRWHPRARVAVAGSCVAARAATWAPARGREMVIVPPEGDADYLIGAPLALIPMDDELRETLAALGIHTAGAFAALDAEDVECRWGRVGLDAWRLARGEDRRRPVLARVDAARTVEAELSAPTTTLEPITFLVRAALDSLAATLASDGRAAAAVAITLVLDDVRSALPTGAPPHTITREARLARPTARAAHLFEHCRALLERWPLDAGVRGVRVAIVATAPLSGEQGDLLSPEWRDTAAMDAAFARLHAELGAGGVVRPEAREEHRPEREGEWSEGAGRSKQETGTHHAGSAEAGARTMALRLLEVPEMVEVEQEAGVPCAVWWRGGRVSIAHAAGPERLSGEWWTGDGYRREYWRCEGGGGSRSGSELLVFQDREEGGWYVQGWYD